MSQFKRLRGSYWEHYPVPENAQRAMYRRTLHEAFGGEPMLYTVPQPVRWRWAYRLAYAIALSGLLTALLAARAHGLQ